MAQHIVNISGGKDSAATYLLAIQSGRPFRAVTADTGHEHPLTYEWIRHLHIKSGGPEVEVFNYDFSQKIASKKKGLKTKWQKDGVEKDLIDEALALLKPTGIPFLDLCLWKGIFPSTRARFCTEWLKVTPIYEQVLLPALEKDSVIRWQGERAAESEARARLPKWQKVAGNKHQMRIYRPILEWSAADVFDLHKKFNLEPNPLYKQGMSRVGCFPCIMAAKNELSAIASRYPEAFEKLMDWEKAVGKVSRRGQATFFSADKTPQGAALAKDKSVEEHTKIYPNAKNVMMWSKTSRGGNQLDLVKYLDNSAACSSEYGLCE